MFSKFIALKRLASELTEVCVDQNARGKKGEVRYFFSAGITVLAWFNLDEVPLVKADSLSFASSSSFDVKSILRCV